MTDSCKSDLIFEASDDFIDAIEEAVERLSRITTEGPFIDDIERAVEALTAAGWCDNSDK